MKGLLLFIHVFFLCFFTVTAKALIENSTIHNYSSKPWKVDFSLTDGFISLDNHWEKTLTLLINPYESIPIDYMPEEIFLNRASGENYFLHGKVILTDFENNPRCYLIASSPWKPVSIQHHGNTGPVVLNGIGALSHGGEIDFVNDSWGTSQTDKTQLGFGSTC
jgi:hypothetical protein